MVMLVARNVSLYITFVVLFFSDQCEQQKATVSTQVSRGTEKENVSTPSEGEKPPEKGECLFSDASSCTPIHF